MPAKLFEQNKAIQSLFYSKIEESNQRKQQNSASNRDTHLEERNRKQGLRGERLVRMALLFNLSNKYSLLNDIVLEVRPNEFIQVDHLVISTNGIFVIETKSWTGEFDLFSQGWKKKGNYKNFDCDTNPITQNTRHVNLLKEWFKDNLTYKEYAQVEKFIYPIVVLKDGKVSKNECEHTMPIRDGGIATALHIKSTLGENIPKELLDKIISLIKHAEPLDHWTWMHSHYKFSDARTITVEGTFELAQEINRIYKNKGFDTSQIQNGKGENTYQFSIKNHIDMDFISRSDTVKNVYYKPIMNRKLTTSILKTSRKVILTGLVAATLIYGINLANKVLENSKIFTQLPAQASEIEEKQIIMQFVVGNHPNSKGTYIGLKDGKKSLIAGIYKKGTEVHFFRDKTVKLLIPGKDTKVFIINNDTINLEVANRFTTIYHGSETYKGLGFFKYDYPTDALIKKD